MRYVALIAILVALAGCAESSPGDLRTQAASQRANAAALEAQARQLEQEQAAAARARQEAAIRAAQAATAAAYVPPTPIPAPTAAPTLTPTPTPEPTAAPVAPLVIVPTVIVYVTVNAPGQVVREVPVTVTAGAQVVAQPSAQAEEVAAQSSSTDDRPVLALAVAAVFALVAAGLLAPYAARWWRRTSGNAQR